MTIKEIFEKAENGTLTYDQFVGLAKDSKFADLTEGQYVGIQKFNDEVSGKDEQIKKLNDTLGQRNTDLEALKKQLDSAGTDATKLQELQGKFDSLQTQYETDKNNYEAMLSKQKYEFAVREFANSKKFTSKAAKRDFERTMLAKELQMEGNSILGAEDFVKSYSAENDDAFVVEKPIETPKLEESGVPHFVAPTTGNNKPPIDSNPFGFHFTPIHKE